MSTLRHLTSAITAENGSLIESGVSSVSIGCWFESYWCSIDRTSYTIETLVVCWVSAIGWST